MNKVTFKIIKTSRDHYKIKGQIVVYSLNITELSQVLLYRCLMHLIFFKEHDKVQMKLKVHNIKCTTITLEKQTTLPMTMPLVAPT